MTVAIMGCVVNGPGEAREADIGIAGGKGQGILFKKGEIVRKINGDRLVEELLEEIDNLRLNVSGVSLDEEMVNLIQFQHSYNASAKVISTPSIVIFSSFFFHIFLPFLPFIIRFQKIRKQEKPSSKR